MNRQADINEATCRSGLHAWTPENIVVKGGKQRCRPCLNTRKRESYARQVPPKCAIDDCPTPARRDRLCRSHYNRREKYGDALAGPPIHRAARNAEERKQRQLGAAKRYRDSHKAQELARYRRYRQENWATVRASLYRWRAAHPDEWHAIVYNARDRRRAQIGAATERVDYRAILAEHGLTCHLCSQPIDPSLNDLDFDHVIPLARGGPHAAHNIRPSHSRCNRSKGARLLP